MAAGAITLAELTDPVPIHEMVEFLGWSESRVRDSRIRFDAAAIQLAKCGDPAERAQILAHMRRYIPCHRTAGVEQENGTFKYATYSTPLSAFLRWYPTVGLDAATLNELYGEVAS